MKELHSAIAWQFVNIIIQDACEINKGYIEKTMWFPWVLQDVKGAPTRKRKKMPAASFFDQTRTINIHPHASRTFSNSNS